MGRHDDVLVLEPGVGAGQETGHVRGFERAKLHRGLGAQGDCQGEAWQRLVRGGQLLDFVEGMAAALEEFRGAAPSDGHGDLLPGAFLQRGVGQNHAQRRRRRSAAAPAAAGLSASRSVRPGIRNGRDPDGSGAPQRGPSLHGGRVMRLHVIARLDRAGGVDVDRDLPVQIDSLEIVVMRLRDRHSVSHEHHGRLEGRREVGAAVEAGVLPQGEGFGLAVAHQGEAALRRNELPRLELDRLPVAGDAGGLEAEPVEVGLHVLHGLLETLAAGVAALELIARQELDVGPPEFAFGGIIGGEEAGGGQAQQSGNLHGSLDSYRSSTVGESPIRLISSRIISDRPQGPEAAPVR